MKKYFLLLTVLCLIGCAEKLPKIDSSTPEAYKASIEQVTASVPKESEEKFRFAMGILSFESLKDYIVDGVIMIDPDSEEEIQTRQQFQKSLHGLNYKQIVARTDQLMRSKLELARERYEEEMIKSLEEARAVTNAEPELAKIVESNFQMNSREISMQIENGTKLYLTELWFLGLVQPTEYQFPNTRFETLNFDKPLAPGEKRTVVISLRKGWKSTDYLAMPRIVLVVTRAEDTKKRVIIHEKFVNAFERYVQLSRNYDELLGLLQGEDDWVNAFTTENIVKGFFPLK